MEATELVQSLQHQCFVCLCRRNGLESEYWHWRWCSSRCNFRCLASASKRRTGFRWRQSTKDKTGTFWEAICPPNEWDGADTRCWIRIPRVQTVSRPAGCGFVAGEACRWRRAGRKVGGSLWCRNERNRVPRRRNFVSCSAISFVGRYATRRTMFSRTTFRILRWIRNSAPSEDLCSWRTT